MKCPNKAYNLFIKLYKAAFDRAFPLKPHTIKTNTLAHDPWLTRGILTSSRNKSKLHKTKLKKPTDHNINKAIRDGRPRPPRHQVGWDIVRRGRP